jgi:hypothetical protein
MALFGFVIKNTPLYILCDITDYFSHVWMQETAIFVDVFPRDEFQLLFWYLHFAHAEGQGKF